MDDVKGKPEKFETGVTGQVVNPRHRRWWQGLAASTMFWAAAFLPWLIRNSALRQYLYEIQQTRPETLVRCMLQTMPFLWMVCALGLQTLNLLRTYCLTRAETTERIKLSDHLQTEPVRRLAKYLYQTIWWLSGTLSLLALYGFPSDLW